MTESTSLMKGKILETLSTGKNNVAAFVENGRTKTRQMFSPENIKAMPAAIREAVKNAFGQNKEAEPEVGMA